MRTTSQHIRLPGLHQAAVIWGDSGKEGWVHCRARQKDRTTTQHEARPSRRHRSRWHRSALTAEKKGTSAPSTPAERSRPRATKSLRLAKERMINATNRPRRWNHTWPAVVWRERDQKAGVLRATRQRWNDNGRQGGLRSARVCQAGYFWRGRHQQGGVLHAPLPGWNGRCPQQEVRPFTPYDTKTLRYGLPAPKKAQLCCAHHTRAGMINVATKRWVYAGCTRAPVVHTVGEGQERRSTARSTARIVEIWK